MSSNATAAAMRSFFVLGVWWRCWCWWLGTLCVFLGDGGSVSVVVAAAMAGFHSHKNMRPQQGPWGSMVPSSSFSSSSHSSTVFQAQMVSPLSHQQQHWPQEQQLQHHVQLGLTPSGSLRHHYQQHHSYICTSPSRQRHPVNSIVTTAKTTTTTTTFRLRSSLFSSRKDLEDMDDNDDDDSDDDEDDALFSYAPETERDSYVSEADQAILANELVSASLEADDNNNDFDDSDSSFGLLPTSVELQDEVSQSFLQYALSIILGRAIPDARDGLKPVHRRILYAMDRLGLHPKDKPRKCARVVGEVLGKFHPHGDGAVYDALVRLAQDFGTHHLLIDGHGNFGSIDADLAAAMRYTECRLTPLAQEALLSDLTTGGDSTETAAIVDFVPNFDGSEVEPTILPARLPILLLNGASGIAVGMATNIPPHNLKEVLTACLAFVEARQEHQQQQHSPQDDGRLAIAEVSDSELFAMVPAPDFPTGATILGTAGAQKLYRTSHGGVILRAKTEIEKIVVSSSSGAVRNAIIVTELPYQVNKAALLEKIADLVNDKKLEGISDLRDESDRDGIRVVIELKRDANAAVVLNNLYQKTPLQTTFSGNFLALLSSTTTTTATRTPTTVTTTEDNPTSHNDPKEENDHSVGSSSSTTSSSIVPQRFTLRQAIDYFLDFRFQTMRRKARYQLSKVDARRHILNGLIVALTKVDEVIDIIRSAADPKTARGILGKTLGLSTEQTDAILNLQLSQLSRLSQDKLQNEQQELQMKGDRLRTLLDVDNAVYDDMKEEFRYFIKKYGRERKTQILPDEDGALIEINMIKNSRSVIVVTRGGYIKRMPLQTFESQGRGTRGKRGTLSGAKGGKNNDDADDYEISQCFTCNDHDMLLMVTQKGIAYGIYAYQVPTGGRTAKGQPIPSVLPIPPSDTITTVMPVSDFLENEYIVLATTQGWIKKTPLRAFEKLSARGLVIATLEENDQLTGCHHCRDGDDILVGTAMGMASRFPVESVRPTGRKSRGVKAMKLRKGDKVADINVLTAEEVVEDEDGSGVDSEHESPSQQRQQRRRRPRTPQRLVLVITASGYGKLVSPSEYLTKRRGGRGVVTMKFKKPSSLSPRLGSKRISGGSNDHLEANSSHDSTTNSGSNTTINGGGGGDRVCCLRSVRPDDEILVTTTKGIMLRQKVSEIAIQGRAATGVCIQKLDEGDSIWSVGVLPEATSEEMESHALT